MSSYLRFEVELPRFSKCFMCLPLRDGLIAWGVLEAAFSFLLTIFMLLCTDLPNSTGPLIVFSIFWTANGVLSIALIYSVKKNSTQYLNYCYTYYALRWYSYATIIFINIVFSGFFFHNYININADPATTYLIQKNLPLGCICLLLQGYLVFLIRSLILILGGTPRASIMLPKCTCMDKNQELQEILEEENQAEESKDQLHVLPPKYEEVTDDVPPVVIHVTSPQESAPTISTSETMTVQQQRQK